MGEGCHLISSRELKEEMERTAAQAVESFSNTHPEQKLSLSHVLPQEAREEIDAFYQRSQKR